MDLKKFVKWALVEGPFDGSDLDGGDVQSKAVECGILVLVKYDPTIHAESDDAEPGDEWYVFSDEFRALESTVQEPINRSDAE